MRLTTLALLLLTGTLAAQLPDAPPASHPRTPPLVWVLAGVYAAGIVADDVSTQRFERHGYVEGQSSWLYGRHPQEGRFLLTSFAIAGVEVWAARRMARSPHRAWRWAGYALLADEAGGRWRSAGRNFTLH